MARIVLDQDAPKNGDTVTFTVTQSGGAKEVRLVLGEGGKVNLYPPLDPVQDETKAVGSDFVLQHGDCTGVAWLLKRGKPVVGTLFWITS